MCWDPPPRPDIVDGIGDHVSYFSISTLDRLLSKCSLVFFGTFVQLS